MSIPEAVALQNVITPPTVCDTLNGSILYMCVKVFYVLLLFLFLLCRNAGGTAPTAAIYRYRPI